MNPLRLVCTCVAAAALCFAPNAVAAEPAETPPATCSPGDTTCTATPTDDAEPCGVECQSGVPEDGVNPDTPVADGGCVPAEICETGSGIPTDQDGADQDGRESTGALAADAVGAGCYAPMAYSGALPVTGTDELVYTLVLGLVLVLSGGLLLAGRTLVGLRRAALHNADRALEDLGAAR